MEYQSCKLKRPVLPIAGAHLTCRHTHLPIAGAVGLNPPVSQEDLESIETPALGSVFILSHLSPNPKDVRDS